MSKSNQNPYKILKVKPNSSFDEIKSAYRQLVKKFHPDAGGNNHEIIEINKAWEILKDHDKRKELDLIQNNNHNNKINFSNKNYSSINKNDYMNGSELDNEVISWMKKIYTPIDKLIGQVINRFQPALKELSADPYDDILMESFCIYIQDSNKKMKKANQIYTSKSSPKILIPFSLSLYNCFSQVQDGVNELDRYTMGYVDNYLHDGKEMIREAKRNRRQLHEEKKQMNFL